MLPSSLNPEVFPELRNVMSDLLPPPGWYDDVQCPGGLRWWNGESWSQHRQPPPLSRSVRVDTFSSPGSTCPATFESPGSVPSSDGNTGRWWTRRRIMITAGMLAAFAVAAALTQESASTDLEVAGIEAVHRSEVRPKEQEQRLRPFVDDDPGEYVVATTGSTTTTAAVADDSTLSLPAENSTHTSSDIVELDSQSLAVDASSTTGGSTTSTPPTTTMSTTVTTVSTMVKTANDPTTGSTDSPCDPNYKGACVPIASDVDCAGGSGNGPAYVEGPVTVVGTDIYDLDRDNDGVGCET